MMLNVIEYLLDEEESDSGINAISLVQQPAIESDWVMLSKQEFKLKAIDDERRLLMGAILIPNKPILRLDEDNNEYYIYFSKDTLTKVMERYMKNGLQGETTLEHNLKLNGSDVYLSEIWMKEDDVHDKSVLHGVEAPIGSIIGSMKIEDDEVWEEAKLGKVNGFSIEGLFTDRVMQSKTLYEQINDLIT